MSERAQQRCWNPHSIRQLTACRDELLSATGVIRLARRLLEAQYTSPTPGIPATFTLHQWNDMIFTETRLKGAFVIDLERRDDDRGFFARAFCQREFAEHGLKPVIAQANIGFNRRKGTIRGMHFQYPPAAESKLVRCNRGAILDIIVDLRPESPTYLRHTTVELTADNHRGIYIPERFAHGYQALEDTTETTYHVGEFYTPGSEGGLPHDDPSLNLQWPLPISVISDKDRQWRPVSEIGNDLASRMRIV